jgi:hypothetical protein
LFFSVNGQMVGGPVTVTFNLPARPCVENRTALTFQVTLAMSPNAFGSTASVILCVERARSATAVKREVRVRVQADEGGIPAMGRARRAAGAQQPLPQRRPPRRGVS